CFILCRVKNFCILLSPLDSWHLGHLCSLFMKWYGVTLYTLPHVTCFTLILTSTLTKSSIKTYSPSDIFLTSSLKDISVLLTIAEHFVHRFLLLKSDQLILNSCPLEHSITNFS